MRRLLMGWFACWLTVTLAAEQVAPAQFESQQSIHLDAHGAAVYRFELPIQAYAGSHRRDLGDIRIFNGSGLVVPHAWLHDAPPAQIETTHQPVTFFPLRRDSRKNDERLDVSVRQIAGGALVSTQVTSSKQQISHLAGYLVDASAIKEARRALILAWQSPPTGTVLPVQVEASDDLQTWHQISADAQLVDLQSGEQHLRQDHINLAGSTSKYFRFRWSPAKKVSRFLR